MPRFLNHHFEVSNDYDAGQQYCNDFSQCIPIRLTLNHTTKGYHHVCKYDKDCFILKLQTIESVRGMGLRVNNVQYVEELNPQEYENLVQITILFKSCPREINIEDNVCQNNEEASNTEN